MRAANNKSLFARTLTFVIQLEE